MPLGIPHSIFLGRPWPLPGEPMWLPDDQDVALAFMRERESICDVCGTSERMWDGDVDAMVAIVRKCFGCEAIEMKRAELADQEETLRGGKLALIPFADWERMEEAAEAAEEARRASEEQD